MNLQLVIAGGLFSLVGVLLGGLLTPLTQFFLERKRERRAADRAKLLVAAELLQAQMILRAVSKRGHWPFFEDLDAFLPTSAWRENRSSIAGVVSDDLWVQVVMAYSLLEVDRSRFATANKIPATTSLTAEIAQSMKESTAELGRLRRQLGVGGGWLDDIENKRKPEPNGKGRQEPVLTSGPDQERPNQAVNRSGGSGRS